jgi:amidase
MIGCIGVAPAKGPASTIRPVYPGGGNLDLRELRPGARISLPVEVEGAFLSVGDLHANPSQGEPAFVAVEAAGTATVRLSLTKQTHLPAPRLHVDGATVCVGMGASFPEARASAVLQAYGVLKTEHGMSDSTAYAYTCARVGILPAGPSGSMMADGLEAVLAWIPHPQDDRT